MNHPNPEELVEFLDGELSPPRQVEVERHVVECGQCGRLVASWRDVRSRFPSWELRDRAGAHAGSLPIANRRTFGRAAAAILLLAAGFSAARFTTRIPDTDQLRAELAEQLRAELGSELNTALFDLAAAQSTEQEAYHQAVVEFLSELDARWLAELGRLRTDIETVAVNTQEEFARRGSPAP
jgi:hypothetical protein